MPDNIAFMKAGNRNSWRVGLVVLTLLANGIVDSTQAETGITNFVDGTTNTTSLIIGNAGSLNYWVVTNAAVITNFGAAAVIGSGGGAHNNSLILTNGGLMVSTNGLTIGSNPGANTLNASSNLVSVVGGGSLLSAGGQNLIVGLSSGSSVPHADFNALLIDGGTVTNVNSFIVGWASGITTPSLNNSVLVTNGGQLFTQFGGVGYQTMGNYTVSYNTNNTVTVTDNSLWNLNNSALYVGFSAQDSRSLAGDDVVQVDTGSVITNVAGIIVGYGGLADGNRLVITNGGKLFNTGTVLVGAARNTVNTTIPPAFAGNNLLLVMGGSGGTSVLDLGGASLTNGIAGINASNNAQGSNNIVQVDAGGVLTNAGSIVVGAQVNGGRVDSPASNFETGNKLIVTNGGQLFSGNVTIGVNVGAPYGSTSNLYSIGGGARTTVSNGLITVGSVANHNFMTVNNADLWSSGLTVGSGGSGNSVTISDSTYTNNGSVIIGSGLGTTLNTMTVINSTVQSGGALTIGNNGFNNTLTILANTVWDNGGNGITIGAGIGSGNSVLIDGGGVAGGATMTDIGSMKVGYYTNTTGNSLVITNGGRLYFSAGTGSLTTNATIGFQSSSNTATVVGTPSARSLWDLGGVDLYVGVDTNNGARPGNANRLLIDGGIVTNANSFVVGYAGGIVSVANNNSVVLTNGAQLFTKAGFVGYQSIAGNDVSQASGNTLTLSDHSLWDLGASVLRIGEDIQDVRCTVANNLVQVDTGSVITNVTDIIVGFQASTSNNGLVITNGGKLFNNGNMRLGLAIVSPVNGTSYAANNYVSVMGGSGGTSVLDMGGGSITNGMAGSASVTLTSLATNNVLTVDAGGVLTNVGSITIGYVSTTGPAAANHYASDNKLIVANGGQVFANSVTVGAHAGALTRSATNSVLVSNDGLLDANTLTIGTAAVGNIISNNGGIYQFSIATPTITPNGAGNISLVDGTISFRGITNANVFADVTGSGNQLANIVYSGNNTFRLNSSSNAAGVSAYSFDPNHNATNYYALEMVNGSTLWRSSTLTIGSGGHMRASNTVGTVQATFVSTGSVDVYHSTLTFLSNVAIVGSYHSDPSTNIFDMDLTVAQSGTLSGGVGDRFEFNKSFFIHSTNNVGFNLASSSVAFTGGGMHTNAITGVDLGDDIVAFATAYEHQTNFAYGELHLGSVTDQVCFTCGVLPAPGVTNNALYVGWLDLLGNSLLVTNLHADSGINIYYNASDYRNAYLAGASYQLTDCNFVSGGGWLYPIIPEPSSLLLLLIGSALLSRRTRLR